MTKNIVLLFLALMGGLVFYSTMRKEPEPEKQGRGTLNSRLAGVMTLEEKQQIIDTFNNPPSSLEHHSPPDSNDPDDKSSWYLTYSKFKTEWGNRP